MVIFDSSQLNSIFPFYVLLNNSLVVESNGKTIEKLFPGIAGKPFFENFNIISHDFATLDFHSLTSIDNQLVTLACNNPQKTVLRGQIEFLPADNQLLFIGSPWFGSMEQVIENKLSIDDFAYHDTLFDLLHVLETQEIASDKLKDALLTVHKQKDELKNAANELHNIALFPMQNPDPLIRIDLHGNILHLNPVAEKLNEFVYKNRKFNPTEFWHEIIKWINPENEKESFEANSGEKLYSFVLKPLLSDGYFNIYGRDVTEEKEKENQLLILSSIAAENTNGVVIADKEGKIEWANKSYEQMTGYKLEEIKGKKPGSFLQGKDSSKETIAYLKEKIYKGEPFGCEILNYNKSGKPYWLRILGQALKDKDGIITNYFSIEEDITKQKVSEQALKESEAKYRYLIENINEVIYETDEDGNIKYISPSFEKLIGFAPEEVIGKSVFHFIGNDATSLAGWKNLITEKKELQSEYKIKNKRGEPCWVHFSTKGIFEDGILKGGTGTLVDITELKNTQFELEKLSLFTRANRQGIHFTDADLIINYANNALLNMTGYDANEIIGKTPPEIFHGPLTQKDRVEILESGHHFRKPVNVDLILYRKDKSWFWANVKKQPFETNDDNTQEYFSIIEDISEKKMAEESLINSEKRLAALIVNLKEGVLLEDENRRILLTNNTFCSMFNIPASPEQLTGADCSNSAEDSKYLFKNPEVFVKQIDKILLEKKIVLTEEIELVNGNYYERDYIPIIINNITKGHLWKYVDITDRKNQEKTLKQKEEKYRNIIANMKMGLLETDTNDVIDYVNQQFCEMSGYSREDILGTKSIDLLVADEYKQVVKEKSSLRLAGVSDTYPIQVKIKNGELRWWLTSGGPNYNDKGKLIGTVGLSVDITEQKIFEQELRIAQKKAEESSLAKEVFLANMSHEIRTPLNAIIGLIRDLSRESLSQSQTLYIKNAGMASQHLLSIVNDVLDITKIESGQMNLDPGTFSLIEVINDAVSILNPSAEEKMIEISTVVSTALAPAYIGDLNRIKQILLNIISNAIKFTEKGSISVECEVIAKSENIHHLQFKIADTGIGMDETFLKNIFHKFSQGDYSTARKYGGTGLGMAITYELIQLMKGEINVLSKIGTGTTVILEIKLETGVATEIKDLKSPGIYDRLKGRHILLVEDNYLNRLVALNSLSYFGMNVTEAENGIEAIEILKSTDFDLILMDLQMPEMGGLEATVKIRQEIGLKTPVIALTANAFKAEIDRCKAAGMNDYVIKPFEEKILLETMIRNISFSEKVTPPQYSENVNAKEVKLYDLKAIVEMSRGNTDFVKKIARVFIDQTPIAVEEIKAALQERDFETIKKVAHRIKPNLANFGIDSLKQDILKIEALAMENSSTPELEVLIKNLDKIIKVVIEQLSAYEL